MDGELLYKIIQRIEGVTGIKELLILSRWLCSTFPLWRGV